MIELNKVMRDKSADPEAVWTAGMECVARASSDKRWYRAVIGDAVGDKLKVAEDSVVMLFCLNKLVYLYI